MVAVKYSQLRSLDVQSQFETTLKSHSMGKVLIDQNIAGDNFAPYVAIATRTKHPFTLLSHTTESMHQNDPIAVLLAADTAVNIDNIYLN